jgi:hypothetical protein
MQVETQHMDMETTCQRVWRNMAKRWISWRLYFVRKMWWSSEQQIWVQLKFTSGQSIHQTQAEIIQLVIHGKVDNKDSTQGGLILAKPGAKAYSLNLQSPVDFGKGLISHDWKCLLPCVCICHVHHNKMTPQHHANHL